MIEAASLDDRRAAGMSVDHGDRPTSPATVSARPVWVRGVAHDSTALAMIDHQIRPKAIAATNSPRTRRRWHRQQ